MNDPYLAKLSEVRDLVVLKNADLAAQISGLGGLIVAATLLVVFVLAVQIAVKVVIFRGIIRSNNRLADKCEALLQMISVHGQITDSQKVRVDRTMQTVTSAFQADRQVLSEIHDDVKVVKETVTNTPPSGSGTYAAPGGPS